MIRTTFSRDDPLLEVEFVFEAILIHAKRRRYYDYYTTRRANGKQLGTACTPFCMADNDDWARKGIRVLAAPLSAALRHF